MSLGANAMVERNAPVVKAKGEGVEEGVRHLEGFKEATLVGKALATIRLMCCAMDAINLDI